MKDKNIIRYTRSHLPKGKTDFEKLKKMSEKDIERSAESDSENPRWTQKMLDAAALNMPQKKVSVHMYVDADVIDWFKSDGKGYQTRINSVLKSYVHRHIHKHT